MDKSGVSRAGSPMPSSVGRRRASSPSTSALLKESGLAEGTEAFRQQAILPSQCRRREASIGSRGVEPPGAWLKTDLWGPIRCQEPNGESRQDTPRHRIVPARMAVMLISHRGQPVCPNSLNLAVPAHCGTASLPSQPDREMLCLAVERRVLLCSRARLTVLGREVDPRHKAFVASVLI